MSLEQVARQRTELLDDIYGSALSGLQTDSSQWSNLLSSGKIWVNHFRPQKKQSYMIAQRHLQDQLDCIDERRTMLHKDGPDLHRRLVWLLTAQYAHQSVVFANNKSTLEDTLIVEDQILRMGIVPSTSLSKLSTQSLPSPFSLLPRKPPLQVAELRNVVVATHYIALRALTNPSGSGISVGELKLLAKILVVDTKHAEQTNAVEYRDTGAWLESDPTRIFPEPQEVPALVAQFSRWQVASNGPHPLIRAAHLTAYFLHIHPFDDCNGRVAQLLAADLLIRTGHVPVVFQDVEREEYLQLVSRAQDGFAKPLCRAIVRTQHDQFLDLMT